MHQRNRSKESIRKTLILLGKKRGERDRERENEKKKKGVVVVYAMNQV